MSSSSLNRHPRNTFVTGGKPAHSLLYIRNKDADREFWHQSRKLAKMVRDIKARFSSKNDPTDTARD